MRQHLLARFAAQRWFVKFGSGLAAPKKRVLFGKRHLHEEFLFIHEGDREKALISNGMWEPCTALYTPGSYCKLLQKTASMLAPSDQVKGVRARELDTLPHTS